MCMFSHSIRSNAFTKLIKTKRKRSVTYQDTWFVDVHVIQMVNEMNLSKRKKIIRKDPLNYIM